MMRLLTILLIASMPSLVRGEPLPFIQQELDSMRMVRDNVPKRPVKIVEVSSVQGDFVAVMIEPPYRDFPNVVFFRKDKRGKWNRVAEALSLGIQDRTSITPDTHVLKEGVDFSVEQIPAPHSFDARVKNLIQFSAERQNVIVPYAGFFHMHPGGTKTYVIDKTAYTSIASVMVSPRYLSDYKQDECLMYDTPLLRGIRFEHRPADGYQLVGLTENHQRWEVRFQGADDDGYLREKRIEVKSESGPSVWPAPPSNKKRLPPSAKAGILPRG